MEWNGREEGFEGEVGMNLVDLCFEAEVDAEAGVAGQASRLVVVEEIGFLFARCPWRKERETC